MILAAHIIGGFFAAIGLFFFVGIAFYWKTFRRGFITEQERRIKKKGTPKID